MRHARSITTAVLIVAALAAGVRAQSQIDSAAPPDGVISGRILDALGEPLVGMTVGAVPVGGGRAVATASTDDRGEYRVGRLPEGNFLIRVSITGRSPADGGRIRIYYPGTSEAADAQVIAVAAHEVRGGIDFAVSASPASSPNQPTTVAESGPVASTGAVVRGQVTDTDGRVLSQVAVNLASEGEASGGFTANTDEQGRYVIPNLPARAFHLTALRRGYLRGAYHQVAADDDGEVIVLRPGETREGLNIVLQQPSAIAGQVVDESGAAVEGVVMRAFQVQYDIGRHRLVEAPGVDPRRTDDRGQYRLFGLPPGLYVVAAFAKDPYPTQYFPDSPVADGAQPLSVDAAQQTIEANFTLRRAATSRLTGIAYGASGRPAQGTAFLVPVGRSESLAPVPLTARAGADGTFAFSNVPQGHYLLQIMTATALSTAAEFGSTAIEVTGGDITDVTLQLSAGSTAKGRITLEGEPDAAISRAIDLSAQPLDPGQTSLTAKLGAAADIRADRTFEIAGLHGRRVFRLGQPPAGWMLKAIRLNGEDVTDRPLEFGQPDQSIDGLEVVLTKPVTEIAGVATAGGGRRVSGAAVVVFSRDRETWTPGSRHLALVKTASDGSFDVRGLPPGEYFMAAVERIADGEWQNPDVLDRLSASAEFVALTEAQKVSVSVPVVRPF